MKIFFNSKKSNYDGTNTLIKTKNKNPKERTKAKLPDHENEKNVVYF